MSNSQISIFAFQANLIFGTITYQLLNYPDSLCIVGLMIKEEIYV